MTLSSKIATALVVEGKELTAKQMANFFGTSTQSVMSRISELRRFSGFAIYRNKSVDTNNRVVYKYRAGTPSRAVVAAGYQALAAS